MTTIDKRATEFVWVLVELDGLDVDDLRRRVGERYRMDTGLRGAVVSINRSIDGKRALVKVPASAKWIQTWPPTIKSKIVRVFTKDDHAEAVALVNSREWAGEPERL